MRKLLAREPSSLMLRAADERQGTGHPYIDIWTSMWDAADTERDWKAAFEEEHEIVARIWRQLGNPSYEDLNGRSIFDLIDELKASANREVAK